MLSPSLVSNPKCYKAEQASFTNVSRKKTFEVRYVEGAGRIQFFTEMYYNSIVAAYRFLLHVY